MLSKPARSFILCLAITACSFSAVLPACEHPSQDAAPANPPVSDRPKATAAQQQPTTPSAPSKPTVPHKHVYTNDDMKGGSESGYLDFNQINDCDNNCFERVRQLAHVMPSPNSNWKRDLLHAIDAVRKDSEWQRYLGDLHNMHLKFCALGDDKRSELNRVADPRNVTPQELSVEEKYAIKFKELQVSLQALQPRQNDLLGKFAINPYSLQFANLQVSRVLNASCGYPSYYPSRSSDDEDP